MNTIPEPNVQRNSGLTLEKFQEIKANLESENLAEFPSAFQISRNLLKQAWTLNIDAAKSTHLLTTAAKAAARLDICKGCQFFNDTRCIKCGCFMDKQVHVESSQCPVNKWGTDLQTLFPTDIAQKNLENSHREMQIHDLDDFNGTQGQQGIQGIPGNTSRSENQFSKQDAEMISRLATESLELGGHGRFSWKGMRFKAFIEPDGSRRISQLKEKVSMVKSLPNHKDLSVEEQIEFNNLMLKHQGADQEKVFRYKSQIFHMTPNTHKDAKPGQFMIRVIDPNNPPDGVTLPSTVSEPRA